MKNIYFIGIIAFLAACGGTNPDNQNDSSGSKDSLVKSENIESIETIPTNGNSTEYHPNGNIKMEGKLNDNGNREGLWVSYYDNGTKWSESYYNDGKKDGHSLSFFPNSQIRYIGEYQDDEKSGTWTFYDEEGNVVTEETF
jgi:antitoxin component YwqK of YwqJK toxin-antitoxin module